MSERRTAGRLARSTAFFSFATGLSRIAGLVREIVAASYFGVKGPMSAFTIAFQVPNLIRSLFADAALQAAFVPVFTEQLEHRSRKEAFRVASALVFVISVSLGILTALFVLLAPVIMPLFAPGFDDQLTDLTVNLAQLLLPLPWLRRTGFRLARDFDWRDERVMRVLKLMFPVTLGIGLINF